MILRSILNMVNMKSYMNNQSLVRFGQLLLLFVFFTHSLTARAKNETDFIVEEIKVDGLQRMELGTFFNMLPLQVGEKLEKSRIPTIIRTLFAADSFDDIRLFREGNILYVDVVERPTISEIVIDGNKDIKTDQILDAMKGAGFSKGEVYNPAAIKHIIDGLNQQYFSHGKYSVKIISKVILRSRNRVLIQFDVKEGEPARIESINIVGNKLFSNEELLGQFELSTGGWFSYFTSDDQYAREKLSGDLETLRSYYMDRGYLKFLVTSTQVSISPDRKGMFVTINVDEGEKFEVNNISFSGDLILTEKRLKQLMPLTKGDTYSAAAISFTEEQIKENLGHFGYAFAKVTSVPNVEPHSHKVNLKIFIDPGKKVYINRITFEGNETTNDQVLRREIRLMEGGALSTEQIERSKIRLQQLTFVEDVKVETPKVENSDDRVDVNYIIEERSAGIISGGVGYGSTYGLSVNASVSHNNFLGSGKTVGFSANKNKFTGNYSLSYYDPYFTLDGISAGASLNYQSTDFGKVDIAATLLDSRGINFSIGYPVSEVSKLNFSLGFQANDLSADGTLTEQISDFFAENGQNVLEDSDISYDLMKFGASFITNSLNRGIFPDRGTRQVLSFSGSVPGSDLEFYKIDYKIDNYIPIAPGWSFLSRLKLSYGDGYGKNKSLPYFENFYAGGSQTVRGFEKNTIGPRVIQRISGSTNSDSVVDSFDGSFPISLPVEYDTFRTQNRAVGGNARVLGSIELIFPIPFAEKSNSLRTSLFVDIGNLWNTKFDIAKYATSPNILDASDSDTFRASAGLALQWLSPMGPLSISFSKILEKEDSDESETFSFNVGQTF